jgi:hypothetical protein
LPLVSVNAPNLSALLFNRNDANSRVKSEEDTHFSARDSFLSFAIVLCIVMPEIWLRYGGTDVVLDIRFENLSSQVSSTFSAMPDEQVKAALDSIPIIDNSNNSMLLLALSSSRATARVISSIFESVKTKGISADTTITVDVPARVASTLRTNLVALSPNPEAAPSINRIDYHSLEERVKKFHSVIVISQAGFDPLFGFSGSPTALVRALFPAKMAEAFSARKGNVPSPGEQGEPLKIANEALQNLSSSTTSIELVANSAGIAGVHVGTISEAFSSAVDQLKAVATVEADSVRSAVISAGAESGTHSTLASALYSLWNAVHIVRDGGSAVLLAECREGLGGGALQAFVEGRLKAEQIAAMLTTKTTSAGTASAGLLSPSLPSSSSSLLVPPPSSSPLPPSSSGASPYIEGLEHLLYMQEMRQKCELGLVSSLPHYYAGTKLGFTTYTGAKDALEKLLVRNGKGHKALVVSDADITLLKPRV